MTKEELDIRNEAYNKVKILKSNIENLSTSIDLQRSMPVSIDLFGNKLIPKIGEKVLQYAYDLCMEALIDANNEFKKL